MSERDDQSRKIDEEEVRIVQSIVEKNQEGLQRLAREEPSQERGILADIKRKFRDMTSEGPEIGTIVL